MKHIPQSIYDKLNLAPAAPCGNSFERGIQTYLDEDCNIWSCYDNPVKGVQEECIQCIVKRTRTKLIFSIQFLEDMAKWFILQQVNDIPWHEQNHFDNIWYGTCTIN